MEEKLLGEILTRWFTSAGFLPQGHYSQWPHELLWTYTASGIVTGLACFSILAALIRFVRRRRDIQFNRVFLLFAVFVFTIGLTQLSALWIVWHPDYRLDAVVRVVTAVISAATALVLWPLVQKVVDLPGREELGKAIRRLEREIAERKGVEEALRQSQATLRELAAYQERIREDERKRIAREIHDDLGQNLLALRLDMSMLHARTGNSHPRLKSKVGAALDHLDTTMKSIRAIMNNLRPAVLDLGLHAAIEWQVHEFRRLSGIDCALSMNGQEPELDDQQATAVFRVLQESLTNIRRHARASNVRIELAAHDGRLSLAVQDNGVGMHPNERRKTHRFGLVGMAERVAMLDGELRIESVPGQGTVLSLSIPIRTATIADSGA
jgi:signal transduction histidine kinase